MRKGMNKKGQETGGPSSLGFIIGFILIVAVAVFAFYWFYSAGTEIFNKKDILPGDLTVAANACEFSASQGDKTSYCVEPKRMKVAGKEGYFNCPYIKNTLNADIPSAGSITCANGYDNAEIWRSYYCNLLRNAGTDTTKLWVNGDKCSVALTKEKLQTLCGVGGLTEGEACSPTTLTKLWTQSADDGKKYTCCIDVTCSYLAGTWKDKCDASSDTDQTSKVTSVSDKTANKNKACCVSMLA